MKINLSYQFYDLPLRHPFTISRYTVNVQKTVIVTLSDGKFSGYGEATVNPYYQSTEERLRVSLEQAKPLVESAKDLHPEDLWQQLSAILTVDYFALCAIDMAYWDFFSRKQGKTVRSHWSKESAVLPLTSYTIGIDELRVMRQKITEKPWPIYKIKLGTPNDMQIIESLREVTDAVFRIDANCAWTAAQTIAYSKILKEMDVEFIEQPLKADDVDGMKEVKQHSVLPIIADESCQREEDVLACAPSFHGINIKLMKCGGITPALRMISQAKELGLFIMAGCMTESTVGISGLCQIAPLLTYLDADGALLLREDIATGVTFEQGKIVYPDGFGTGVALFEK